MTSLHKWLDSNRDNKTASDLFELIWFRLSNRMPNFGNMSRIAQELRGVYCDSSAKQNS